MLPSPLGSHLHSIMDASLQRSRAASLVTLLSSYASYHQDVRNRRTHFIGVPLITFSLMTALALPSLPLFGTHVGLERIATAALAAYYIYLDLSLGFALTVALALLAGGAEMTVHLGTVLAGATAAVGFIAGWVLQLLGHRLEGNRPALLDNLRQIFVAPIYLMVELAFMLGLRRDLQAQIQQRMTSSASVH
jgi:uncharacterized membrane protein YGL010W